MSKIKVCSESEIQDESIKAFHTKAGAIVIVKTGGKLFALQESCSHADFSLEEGDLLDGGAIECPAHGAQFRLESGEVLKAPATSPLETYPVTVEDGDIYIDG